MVEPVEKKKPESPISAPAPPKASAKPQAHQAIVAIEKFTTILAMPMPAFLPRENPISRNAKPACMNITSTAATRIHITLTSSVNASIPLTADLLVRDSRAGVSARPGQGSLARCRRFAPGASPEGGGLPHGETHDADVCPDGHTPGAEA